MAHASLTGTWSGAYRYPRDAAPETVFNAEINEVDGAFIGAVHEPNFLAEGGSVLTAEIEGVRSGQSVTFTKFYAHEGIRDAVRYEGDADNELSRVIGNWSIRGVWSGTFVMVRDDAGESAQTEERAEAIIDVRK